MADVILIGAGRMGHRFSQAIRQSGNTLLAIFDPGEKPFAVEAEPELASFHIRDFQEVLDSSAEVFVICTTAEHHVSIASELIRSGKKRLVIEKPLSQSLADAEVLQALTDEFNARVVVNHGRRYCENTALLKSLDGADKTGSLRSISITMGGGALGCVGTHWIDLCNNLMGSLPEKVFCELSAYTPGNNRGAKFFDPGGTACLFYAGGRRAILNMGDDVGIVAGADFVYETGLVTWAVESGKWVFRHRSEENREKSLALYGIPLEESAVETKAPDLIAYGISALDDVLSDAPIQSGLMQARDTMEVFCAMRNSAEDESVVRLPLDEAAKQVVYSIP
ncbi:Gfo/Idh/MocA family oxidoreductase [Cognatishimia sp. 1_MG-2023]|uniref:Gfo/Idh/MocA family protein n=1 Tax=Cognatishimia sp. 1_MG-2023 TaxID=3062642 RepID=UPI0026E37635|nr:Gfo/Idh/MocA family oxidoreductase [Cognatishimia sp. 1_MG-2023]MDO6728351.1 Gfo/Idh/MocA family oxidoreductase [Cognatishimia sp. 1_MG-2023]